MELSITLGSYMISQVATTYVAAVNTNGQSPTQKKLDVLYNEIAKDLKNGKPLVISDTVVLWEEGRSVWWGDGENPERNLYWGAKYGLYTMLKQSHEWKEVYRQGPNDNGEITSVVFERDCPTNNFWRSKGVLKPFKTYLVIKAFKASDINKAYELTAKNIFTGNPDQIKLPNGQIIEAGGKSHLIIHSGHMISEGNLPLEQHKSQLSPTKTKGVAFLTCLSKSVFSQAFERRRKSPDQQTYGRLFFRIG